MSEPRPPRIVVFDLETTGLTPASRVIEFGAVTVDGATLAAVAPGIRLLVRADGLGPDVTAMTGISPSDLADKPDFAHRADEIFSALDGATWAGYNIARFDVPMLQREFARIGRPMPRCAGVIDVYAAASAWKLQDATGNLKLDTLSGWYGLGAERHDALDDARRTLDVLLRMLVSHAGSLRLVAEPAPGGWDAPPPPPEPTLLSRSDVDALRRSRGSARDWPPGAVAGASAEAVCRRAMDGAPPPPGCSAVAVQAAYRMRTGSCCAFLLRPRDVSSAGCVRAADMLAGAPSGDETKTFLYSRFVWVRLAAIAAE